MRAPVRSVSILSVLLLCLSLVTACTPQQKAPEKTLRIVAGSEQRAILDQVVTPWCEKKGYACPYELLGSVDQARRLQSGSTDHDAYWFASSVFAQVGNSDSRLQELQPMFLTPVVFAGRKQALERLGLNQPNVTVDQVVTAVQSKQAKVWTTNPTQSNSGATTLFAFLNHFAGNGPGKPLTRDQLDSPEVDKGIKAFVQAMDRTPPSTGTMMDECTASPDQCDTMFTYEALVIEHNRQLSAGQEPLHVIYPQGALAISDAPLGFLPTGSHTTEKKQIFTELQDHLLHDPQARATITGLGRRPAQGVGLTLDNPDPAVFNPAWGVRTDIREQGIAYPSAAVIEETLARYHTSYRRPVNTYYCLDGSGSMTGKGWDGVKAASHEIFDAQRARVNLLQTAAGDRTTVAIFHQSQAGGPWSVAGNDPTQLSLLETRIQNYRPGGGTDMYRCLSEAVKDLSTDADPNRKKLIVLMTDGRSEGNRTAGQEAARRSGIPVVAIAFGDADPEQMQAVAKASGGAFVKSSDLVGALRTAAGYK